MKEVDEFLSQLARVSASLRVKDLDDPEISALFGQLLLVLDPPPQPLSSKLVDAVKDLPGKIEKFRQAAKLMHVSDDADLGQLARSMKALGLFKSEEAA